VAWYWASLPLVAVLANIAAFLSSLQDRDSFSRGFRVLLVLLAGGNLSLAAVLMSEPSANAPLAFHVFRHFAFLAAPTLASLVRILSGRTLDGWMTRILAVFSFLLIVAIEIDFFSERSLLIDHWASHEWGTFPVLAIRARILVGSLFLLCAGSSIYWLVNAKESLVRKPVTFPITLWWLAFVGNFPALLGVGLYPVGMIFETIVSVLIAATLRKNSANHWSQKASEVMACSSLSLTIGVLLSALMPENHFKAIAVSLAAGIAAFLGTDRLRSKQIEKKIPGLASYQLTRQEERICELVAEGYTRAQIGFFLGIADGTLRNHLVHLYAKTVDREKESGVRDKFQRLTLFLLNLQK